MSGTGDLYQQMKDEGVPENRQRSWLERHKQMHTEVSFSRRELVGKNVSVRREPTGEEVYRLHKTDIVTRGMDGSVKVNSGGYQTPTTKKHINLALQKFAPHAGIVQKKGDWFISANGHDFPFADGMTVPVPGFVPPPARNVPSLPVPKPMPRTADGVLQILSGNKVVRVKASRGRKAYVRSKGRK